MNYSFFKPLSHRDQDWKAIYLLSFQIWWMKCFYTDMPDAIIEDGKSR